MPPAYLNAWRQFQPESSECDCSLVISQWKSNFLKSLFKLIAVFLLAAYIIAALAS